LWPRFSSKKYAAISLEPPALQQPDAIPEEQALTYLPTQVEFSRDDDGKNNIPRPPPRILSDVTMPWDLNHPNPPEQQSHNERGAAASEERANSSSSIQSTDDGKDKEGDFSGNEEEDDYVSSRGFSDVLR
jgi:hypothetical protein